jgi:hypothetical protein
MTGMVSRRGFLALSALATASLAFAELRSIKQNAMRIVARIDARLVMVQIGHHQGGSGDRPQSRLVQGRKYLSPLIKSPVYCGEFAGGAFSSTSI